MRFRTKTILGVATIEIVLLAVLISSTLSVLRESNETELANRAQLGGKLLAAAAKDAVIAQDLATLDSLATEAMASGQIVHVRILDAGGTVLTERGDSRYLTRAFHPDTRIDQVTDGVYDWSTPVTAGTIRYGEIQLGISTEPLAILLASAQRWAAGIAGLEILLVAVFSFLLGTYLVRQLVALRKASYSFVMGNYDLRVPVEGSDELADTAKAFNRLAEQLTESNELVRTTNLKRLEAQQAAEKSDHLLREAVSSIAQGFTIYDENDRLVLCNEAYLKFYDTSRDLIVPGATFEEIIRKGAERGQYSAAIGRIDEWVTNRVAQHQNANGEVIEQKLTDGRWLMIVEYKTPSGFIVGNRIDITEIKTVTEALTDRTEQLNAIFALSPDGFVSFDRKHRVKYVSPAFSSMTRLQEINLIGCDESAFSEMVTGLCVTNARFRGIDALRRSMADEKSERRRELIELAAPNSCILEVGLRISNAETVSQILYFRDVTHETEVDRMKSEFLSHAAHELRTPMTSIYGYAELLLAQEFDDETRRDLLSTIHRQSQLMVSIINELLDLVRIEAQRGKDFVFEPVSLAEIVGAAVSGFKPPDGRDSPCVADAPANVLVSGDRTKLQQALTNLISNAYKYSPNGGQVSIGYRTALIDEKTMLGVEVRDHGIGMTPEQLARVFERFYRADTSGNIPGTGLGMSIVKEIMDIHGGRIELQSTPKQGTCVAIFLPESSRHH